MTCLSPNQIDAKQIRQLLPQKKTIKKRAKTLKSQINKLTRMLSGLETKLEVLNKVDRVENGTPYSIYDRLGNRHEALRELEYETVGVKNKRSTIICPSFGNSYSLRLFEEIDGIQVLFYKMDNGFFTGFYPKKKAIALAKEFITTGTIVGNAWIEHHREKYPLDIMSEEKQASLANHIRRD